MDGKEFLQALENITKEKGIDKSYGARPLRRAIQNIVEDSLAEYILDGKIKAGEEVKIAAKQQADQLIAEARNKASEIQQEENEASLKKLDEIEKQIAIKERRFEDVKKQFDVYKAKMESLLISQEELIKEINQDEEE